MGRPLQNLALNNEELDTLQKWSRRSRSNQGLEIQKVVELHQKPNQATHGSSRLMAKELGLSQTAIVRIWHAFGLPPHRRETFKLSSDPHLVAKVRDIVAPLSESSCKCDCFKRR